MSRRRKSTILPRIALGAAVGAGAAFLVDAHVVAVTQTATVILVLLGILVVFIAPRWKKLFRFYPGHLYAFTVRHPRTGRRVCGYVGKTRRDPRVRYEEHLGNGRYGDAAKPWTDTVTDWRVIYSSKRVSDIGLSLREQLHIRLRRPLYNIEYNGRNRRRVKPWEAKAQRLSRNQL